MIYSDKEYENYFMTIDKFGINVYYTDIKDVGDDICEYMNSFQIVDATTMLALPLKDIGGNQIYDNDILECSWSDYYDPCGDKYPKNTPVRFIADVYDAYGMPDNIRIVGNKYENPSLYRQTLWNLRLKDKWRSIEIESYHAGKKHTSWRKGQTLFNVLSAYYPKIAEQITATKYDCFNDDSKIEAFKERVIDLWIEEMGCD